MSFLQKGINLSENFLSNAISNIQKVTNRNSFSHIKPGELTGSEFPEIVNYHVQPGISIPIRPSTFELKTPTNPISKSSINEATVQGELGNFAIQAENDFSISANKYKPQLEDMYEGFEVSVRPKSAASIHSKGNKYLKKDNNLIIYNYDEFKNMIGDGVGQRVILKDLSFNDTLELADKFKINGRELTKSENIVLKKYIKNEPMTKNEKEIIKKIKDPFVSALVEKQSQPVLDNLFASGLKDALNRGAVTMEQIQKAGYNQRIIDKINDPNTLPIRYTELNNYRGNGGIAYFSDKQVKDIDKYIEFIGDKDFIKISCSSKFDNVTDEIIKKYNLTDFEVEAIKKSGYTTAQFNGILPDGTRMETQIRGSSQINEYTHEYYDEITGKNSSQKIKNAVAKLKQDNKQKIYEEQYLTDFSNYVRKLQLGMKAHKPNLPEGIDSSLSMDNLAKQNKRNHINQENIKKNFKPHIEQLSLSV